MMTDHSIIMENRESLKITQLDLERGNVSISGECSSLVYTESVQESGVSLLKRLMK